MALSKIPSDALYTEISKPVVKATTGFYHGSMSYWKTRDNSAGSEFVIEYSTSPAMNDANIKYKITSNGIVQTPYQPSFSASCSSNQEPTSNTQLQYSSVNHNRGGHYNSSNSTFTAPVSGVYQFYLRYWHKANTSGSTYVFFYKNGSVFCEFRSSHPTSAAEYVTYNRYTQVYLSAGDYVNVYGYGDSTNLHTSNSIRYSEFSGNFIG